MFCAVSRRPPEQMQRKGISAWDESAKNTAIQQLALWTMRNGQSADIALLQERDFYSRGLDDYLVETARTPKVEFQILTDHRLRTKGSVAQLDIQEMMERIIWKGDFTQVKSVSGSVLKTVLKESSQFAKTEKTAYLPASEVGRPLVTIGISPTSRMEAIIWSMVNRSIPAPYIPWLPPII